MLLQLRHSLRFRFLFFPNQYVVISNKKTIIISYIVEPETWNAVYELVGGRDEVPSHYESDALTESRPVIVAKR